MIKSYVSSVFFALIIGLIFSSCTSSKKILYFQGLDTNRVDSVRFDKVHLLQYGDMIEISVTSLEPDDYAHFSKSGFRVMQDQAVQNAYQVDSSGIISLPYIGPIAIAGLSTIELKQKITTAIEPYLQKATVNIRLMNLKISVLGEVARPGTYQIPDMRIALPEALGLAGDLTISAKRSNVLIIREEKGQRNYARIDLRKPDVLSSEYYYLKPNDIIYIEPSRSKIAQNDTRTWQVLALLSTVASLATILITRL